MPLTLFTTVKTELPDPRKSTIPPALASSGVTAWGHFYWLLLLPALTTGPASFSPGFTIPVLVLEPMAAQMRRNLGLKQYLKDQLLDKL